MPEIKRKEQEAKENWTLTAEDLDRIAADLWPSVHGPADEVTSVKGTKPKRPPLTYEAKHALQRLVDNVIQINGILDGLTERALKGLAFEAVRSSTFQDEALWQGIADEAKRREQIRAAHRTGRGEWYAVLEIARANLNLSLPLGAHYGHAREVREPQGSGRGQPPADGREGILDGRRHRAFGERAIGS